MQIQIRGIKEEDYEELNLMLEEAFHAEDDHRFINKIWPEKPLTEDYCRLFEYDSENDVDGYNLNIKGKRIISHFGVLPQKMQFGAITLMNGGGRDVATLPLAQKKGIGFRVAKDAKDYMFNHNIDFSILFSGAGKFYMKNDWRGGLTSSIYKLNKAELNKWRNLYSAKLKEDLISFEEKQMISALNFTFLSEEKIPALVDLYNKTRHGLYFAVHRDEEYWKRHLKVTPGLKWLYILGYSDSKLIGYSRITLSKIEDNQIQIIFDETGVSPGVNAVGSITLDCFYLKLIDFLKEEALNSNDMIAMINFPFSLNYPIIQHLHYEQLSLIHEKHYNPSHMILITNPYSLFGKLQPEIARRISNYLIPEGEFVLKFDKMNEYPGGISLNVQKNGLECQFEYIVYDSNEDLSKLISQKDEMKFDYAECDSIAFLSMYFSGIFPIIEFDEDDYEGIMLKNNAIKWLIGLFQDVSYDMYHLDHF